MSEETMTLDNIKELNFKISRLCDRYAIYNRPGLVEASKAIIPDIQKFVTWFLGEKDIGVMPEEKAYMDSEVVKMLKDITEAMEKNDSALMFDALECGIAEYLRMFIPEEDFEDEE